MQIPYQLLSIRDRTVSYADGLALQNSLFAARRDGTVPDTLLLLEHSPVITVGRSSHPETDFLRSRTEIEAAGIEVHIADRGGELTYHAPGQLVGYPILELNADACERDLHQYLRRLEQVMIDTLDDLAIAAGRKPGLTGVWVGNEKISAIGIKVSRWVTMHGFALNINVDLTPMERDIVPCGIRDLGVTSLAKLGLEIDRAQVEPLVVANFERILHRSPLD